MFVAWKKSYDQPRQHIKKQRHYFTNKGLSSQSYGFSSSHVWMWELEYKESWSEVKVTHCVWLFVTPWTIQSMEFSRPEYWSLSFLQGIFPTQESNQCFLHCRWILYEPSLKGSPTILEWVAYSFSSRSSQPRNWTKISCIAGRFSTNWAIREALQTQTVWQNLSKTWRV